MPDEILQKPGTLDDEERAVIEKHPVWGMRLLAELGGFSETASGVSCATTTSGWTAAATRPACGEDDLELDARILAVCDVYDALISPRVYRWPVDSRAGDRPPP